MNFVTNDDLKQIGKLLDEKLTSQKEEVIDEMVGLMEEHLFPRFEKMAEKSDIERIERRLDSLAVTVGTREEKIQDMEAIGAIAHQLKVSKKK